MVGAAPLGPAIVDKAESFTSKTLGDNNQAELRYRIGCAKATTAW